MKTKPMQHQYAEARTKLREYLTRTGITDHMFYGPTSEQYWKESFKLVAVNMEPYGYERTGYYEVPRDELVNWIYDEGNTRTRTTRYTLTILGAALTCFHDKVSPSRELLSSIYADGERVEGILDRTVYYNIRAQSNTQKPQDFAAISAVGRSEAGRLVWNEILSLNPDVIVIGGQAGLAAINELLASHETLNFRGSLIVGSLLLQSISHPSRPAYNAWCDAIGRIVKWKNEGA
jgi:hypothetical protein